jgi:hypothetical protein
MGIEFQCAFNQLVEIRVYIVEILPKRFLPNLYLRHQLLSYWRIKGREVLS